MKILDILSSTIPNQIKDKLPKGKAFKVPKSVYGVEHDDDETDDESEDSSNTAPTPAAAGAADGGGAGND